METDKAKILQLITQSINNTFLELDKVKKTISLENVKLLDLTSEYVDLTKEISESRKQISEEFSELQREKDLFQEKKDSFTIELNKFNDNKSKIETDLLNKVKIRDNIKLEIDSLSKKLQSFNIQVKAKETMVAELDSLNKLITQKKDERDLLIKDYENTEKHINKLKLEAEQELNSLHSQIDLTRKIVFPTLTEIKEKEKKLEIKEKDLLIVEERFRKRYEEKGARFRV